MTQLLVARLFSIRFCIIYAITLLVSMLYSLVVPTLSVFLGNEIGVRPFLVGTFFVTIALMGIVYTQSIALWSEKVAVRRGIVFLGMVFGCIACLAFSYFRSFSFALIFGVTCYSFSFVSVSQVLALAREFGVHEVPENTRLFNSLLRSFSALAWAVGPPLGFTVLSVYGFQNFYLCMAVMFLLVGVLIFFAFPKTKNDSNNELPVLNVFNNGIVFIVCFFTLLFAVNHSFLISLPLYLSEWLHVPITFAGWLLGVSAVFQIPIMILSGWLSTRINIFTLIGVGAVAGILLNAGFWFADQLWQLFVFQLFYAVFNGLISALGISIFQEILPGKAGTASALFINCISVGSIIGGLVIAIFADIYGFRQVFVLNVVIIMCALILFAFLPKQYVSSNNH